VVVDGDIQRKLVDEVRIVFIEGHFLDGGESVAHNETGER
jgi:hypothetical protein